MKLQWAERREALGEMVKSILTLTWQADQTAGRLSQIAKLQAGAVDTAAGDDR